VEMVTVKNHLIEHREKE